MHSKNIVQQILIRMWLYRTYQFYIFPKLDGLSKLQTIKKQVLTCSLNASRIPRHRLLMRKENFCTPFVVSEKWNILANFSINWLVAISPRTGVRRKLQTLVVKEAWGYRATGIFESRHLEAWVKGYTLMWKQISTSVVTNRQVLNARSTNPLPILHHNTMNALDIFMPLLHSSYLVWTSISAPYIPVKNMSKKRIGSYKLLEWNYQNKVLQYMTNILNLQLLGVRKHSRFSLESCQPWNIYHQNCLLSCAQGLTTDDPVYFQ